MPTLSCDEASFLLPTFMIDPLGSSARPARSHDLNEIEARLLDRLRTRR
jgi:hypothetical protein